MKVLHIDLKPVGENYAEFRYFWDNINQYQSRQLPLTQIAGLINRAETDYYTSQPVEYAKTGQALYNWLDGSDRLLANALNQNNHEGLILAISTDEGLAHLPWELLHDGNSFLVEKTPPIISLRWVSTKQQQKPIEITNSPQNRPLNLLFMATSPLGVEPVLNYEAEEGQILEATKRIPLNLRVEESGWLQELGYLVQEYDQNYFDVFHLTGHATHKDQKPCFLTEDEYCNCVYSKSRDIADTFNFSLPSLIFLSGCRTGYASDDDIPYMAEELLNRGAKAVLGWGEKVLDTNASTASSKIYEELSAGKTITQALAITYQTLIKENARDWHKLRLYVGDILPQALVTPLRTPRRQPLPKPITTTEFRDDENRLRVASREEFVGRRRQLQNCLRTLRTDSDKVGVLIHGMGGWGKSSIASRLWARLPEHEKIFWWRQIDQSYLISKFEDILITPQTENLIADLKNNQRKLKSRFAYLFSQLAELGEKPFLLILDDFEWNLERRDGGYILKPEVAQILTALIEAIQQTENRIIITCRYDFDSDLLESFYKQGLERFRDADLTKKLSRLEHFKSDKISEDIRKRALNLADGNPRLLEFLNNDVLGKQDAETKLTELEQSPELWQDRIIWEELYQLIDEPLQQILSHCLVYEISVPMEALEVVCESLPNYKQQLQRGLDLGLIEISSEFQESDQVHRVSRILPHVISSIKLPQDEKVLSNISGKAGKKLYQLWGKQENENREKWSEIFRLALADKQNPKRFREQFSKMLCVQFNVISDLYYNMELKINKNELSSEYLFKDLEDYLRKKKWIEADEETTWIFYQIMIVNEYEDLFQLYEEISCDTLNKIDQLWLKYSDGCFGFSIQSKIFNEVFNELNKTEYYQYWIKFCDLVGWKKGEKWLCYSDLFLNLHTCKGTFPALCISHRNLRREGSIWVGGWYWPIEKIKENRFDIERFDIGGEDYRLRLSYFFSIVSKFKECNL